MTGGILSILMHLALALGAIYFVGYGITRLCGRGPALMPAVGFAASQVLFFGFYFVFSDAFMAVVAVFVVAALIAAASFKWAVPQSADAEGGYLGIWWAAIAAAPVLLMAAWPYFLTGWGNFWHSGNEDFFDAIDGRNVFIHKAPAQQAYWKAKLEEQLGESLSDSVWAGGRGNGPFDQGANQPAPPIKRGATPTGPLITQAEAIEDMEALYAGDLGRLQYTSLAFWSVLLDAKQGADAWLIQALLSLVLMVHGLLTLFKRTLASSWKYAAAIAAVAVGNNFYLTTYFNGHQGSLMFMAILPYMLRVLMDVMSKSGAQWQCRNMDGAFGAQWWCQRDFTLLMVILVFVLGTYPYPLVFVLAAALIYYPLQHMGVGLLRQRNLMLGALLLIVLGYVVAWFVFEPVRERALAQFRSWGTMFNEVGLFQFWGVWPSSLSNASHEYMTALLDDKLIMLASYAMSIALTALAVYGLIRGATRRNVLWLSFAIMWLVLLPFMRFVPGDSYYFYKFLYINNFFAVILLMTGYSELVSKKIPLLFKLALSGMVGGWLLLNIAGNLMAAWSSNERPYNQHVAEFESLPGALNGISQHVYIDIPKRGAKGSRTLDYESVVRNYLWDAGLSYETDPGKAKYFLRMLDQDDIDTRQPEKIVWQSKLFSLIEAPASDSMIVKSYWAPEYVKTAQASMDAGRFRWVSDGKHNWLSVDILRRSEASRFLRFCAQKGPSVGNRSIVLNVKDGLGNEVGKFDLLGQGCYWVDLAGKQGPIIIASEAVGVAASRIDTRHLNYRVFNVALTNESHDVAMMRHFNMPDDITPVDDPKRPSSGKIYLVNGWHGLESQSGNKFRWAQTGAQLMVDGCTREIAIDIEPGPSLGMPDMNFTVRTLDGKVLAREKLQGKAVVKVPLTQGASKKTVLVLESESKGLGVPNDARRLDFRVFGVTGARVGHCPG